MDEHGMPEGMTAYDEEATPLVTRDGEPNGPSGKRNRSQLPDSVQPALRAFSRVAIEESLSHAAAFRRAAVARTAALLIVISRNNSYEGRDPSIVCDDLTSGTVSGMLGLDVGVLASVLVDLQHRGLVEPAEAGRLRLTDIAALDRLSEGS